MAEDAVLSCRNLRAGWGATEVLDGISFDLMPGEIIAILGRNGVGKTTLLSSIMGRARQRAGDLLFRGAPLKGLSIVRRSRMGIALVPQEREIFRSLSVLENLRIAAQTGGWSVDQVYDLFPRLAERRGHLGSHLSGGEQQMLSIARGLMTAPKLLMLDEPMEGLAPVIVDLIVAAIDRIRRETGMTILLVEQHGAIAQALSRRVMVMERGRIVYDNGRDAPADSEAIARLIELKQAV